MNNEIILKLNEFINSLILLQDQLIEETKKLRVEILNRDLEKITSLTANIDQIAGKVESVELERRDFLINCEINEREILSYRNLFRLLNIGKEDELYKNYTKLKEKIKEVARINRGNQIMLQEGILAFRSNIDLIIASKRKSVVYDNRGYNSKNSQKVLLNRVG